MNNQDRKAMAAIEKMVAGYRDITRIQIEPLAGGRWRWSIHEGERESFAAAVRVEYQGRMVDRITLTVPVINESAYILFLVVGKDKSEIILKAAGDGCNDLPASRVEPRTGALRIFADTEAARLI